MEPLHSGEIRVITATSTQAATVITFTISGHTRPSTTGVITLRHPDYLVLQFEVGGDERD